MFELSLGGEIARIRIARSKARNAIPLEGWDALAGAVRQAQGARLLILSGSEQAFCAGADLKDFPAMTGYPAAAARFREAMRRGIEAVAALPIPTVALVEGPCYGAGVALALACDLRLAGPSARFAITPAKMGISYPQEDVFRLVSLVGPARSAKLLYTGAAIDAAEALRIGLADGTASEFEEIVSALLASDPASIATLKRGISLAGAGTRSDTAQDAVFDALLASPALAARLEARRRQ